MKYTANYRNIVLSANSKKELQQQKDELLNNILNEDSMPVLLPYTMFDGEQNIAMLWRENNGQWSYKLYATDPNSHSCVMLAETNKQKAEWSMRRHIASICDSEGWEYLDPKDEEGHKRNTERLEWDRKCSQLAKDGCPDNWIWEVANGYKTLEEVLAKTQPTILVQPIETPEPIELVNTPITNMADSQETQSKSKTKEAKPAQLKQKKKGNPVKKADVKGGDYYLKTVSGKKVVVEIIRSRLGSRDGWDALNLATGRYIVVKSASGLSPIPKGKLEQYKKIYCSPTIAKAS